jgi:hypothetical protein
MPTDLKNIDRNFLKPWYWIWFGFVLIGYGCVSPYDFESIANPNALVVEATLTNETKAHLVKLSLAENLDSTSFRSVEGATIHFIRAGEREQLIEVGQGIYRTDSSYQGVPGEAHQMEIRLSDGQQFYSTEVLMPLPVPIDSIYGEYIVIPNNNNVRFQNGVQFFLDAHADGNEPYNFRYEFQESYAIDVPLPSKYDFRGSGMRFEVIERERPLDRCYRIREQSRTILETTRNLRENRVAQLPITFVNESLPDLAYAYRLGVRQYSIDNDAYRYFQSLRDINESAGSLSDRQFGELRGNVLAGDQAELAVLGYFEVAGVSESRRTFNYREFLDDDIKTEEWVCGSLPEEGCLFSGERSVQIVFIREAIHIFFGDTTILRIPYIDYAGLESAVKDPECGVDWRITNVPEGSYAYFAHMNCSDCTIYGLLERPEVWEEL